MSTHIISLSPSVTALNRVNFFNDMKRALRDYIGRNIAIGSRKNEELVFYYFTLNNSDQALTPPINTVFLTLELPFKFQYSKAVPSYSPDGLTTYDIMHYDSDMLGLGHATSEGIDVLNDFQHGNIVHPHNVHLMGSVEESYLKWTL